MIFITSGNWYYSRKQWTAVLAPAAGFRGSREESVLRMLDSGVSVSGVVQCEVRLVHGSVLGGILG